MQIWGKWFKWKSDLWGIFSVVTLAGVIDFSIKVDEEMIFFYHWGITVHSCQRQRATID